MKALDELDRALLNRVQSNFPISQRPFAALGADLGCSEQEVIERLQRLKASGIIRRIGGNFVPEKLGFVSTLCAAKVPEDRIEKFAEIVNRFPGVTHNYQRDNAVNVWFTLIAPSMADIEETLRIISEESGVGNILNLPATRVFKIRAQFDM